MCEPIDSIDYLRPIPFLVESLVEKCCQPGSYEKSMGRAVAKSIRHDIEEAIKLLQKETK